MNISTVIKIVQFLIANWATIKSLISALQELYPDDNAKVKECLDGLCNVAQEQLPPIKKIEKKDDKGSKLWSLLKLIRRR